MIPTKSFILYTLPKSRTTQLLTGGRKIEKAWENICAFLNHCTTVRPDQASSINLTAYTAYVGDKNPEIADKIIAETKHIFGAGQTEPIAYSYPSGIPDKQTKTEWHLEATDLKKVIDYLVNGQPWERFTFGPVELAISFDFKLIDPLTKEELENQELSSSIMIWLGRNCVCSSDFYFPFEKTDSNFENYLKLIHNFLPFKLEQKYFRLGRFNKTKTGYVFTKIKGDV